MELLSAVGNGFMFVLGWMSTFVKGLVTEGGIPAAEGMPAIDLTAFLPMIGIGIAISIVGVCIRYSRTMTWGW